MKNTTLKNASIYDLLMELVERMPESRRYARSKYQSMDEYAEKAKQSGAYNLIKGVLDMLKWGHAENSEIRFKISEAEKNPAISKDDFNSMMELIQKTLPTSSRFLNDWADFEKALRDIGATFDCDLTKETFVEPVREIVSADKIAMMKEAIKQSEINEKVLES